METLLPLLVQVPLVAAFMWFTLETSKRFDEAQAERDKEWRNFMREQREQNNAAIGRIAEEVKGVAQQVAAMNAVLIAHDVKTAQAISQLLK